MTRKLRIYSDKSYVLPKYPHTYMLYPFWGGAYPEKPSAFNNPMVFGDYEAIGNEFFEMTSLEDADVIIAPVAWENHIENRDLTRQLAQYATPEKPIIIFFWHFEKEKVDIPNSIILRTSFYKSARQPNEYPMPLWREDYIKTRYKNNITPRSKKQIPVVGFCGQALLPNMERIQRGKDILRYIRYGIKKTNQNRQKRFWHVFRGKILAQLQRSPHIQTNFIVRSQFFGEVNSQKQDQYQLEFIENTIHSDYIVSMRGTANSSFRLYEALSFGRIPVFINTDCMLPFETDIDWKNICVWVDESEIDQVDQKIMDFHNRLSPEEFINLQKKCRQTWEDYLSPQGFFRHLYRYIESL